MAIGAHGGRELEAIGWRAERDDARGTGQSRERDGAETDGTGPLHEHAVAKDQRRAVNGVHSGNQPAPAADVGFGRHRVRQLRHGHARLEVDGLGPSAEQSLARRVGDAVHTPSLAPRGRARDRAGAAAAARAMHVEEHQAIAFDDGRAVHAAHVTTHLGGDTDRHVAGNDGERHARQASVPDVHVRAAHLRIQRAEQERARLERRFRKLAQLDRYARRRHHGSNDRGQGR